MISTKNLFSVCEGSEAAVPKPLETVKLELADHVPSYPPLNLNLPIMSLAIHL